MNVKEKQMYMTGVYIGIGLITLIIGVVLLWAFSSNSLILSKLFVWIIVFIVAGFACLLLGTLKFFIRRWPWWL